MKGSNQKPKTKPGKIKKIRIREDLITLAICSVSAQLSAAAIPRRIGFYSSIKKNG